ncbi:hypothetical protein ANCDUO_12800 [Ancylostoma duodenale]|uniref:Uncharacterized protein n=1 Tax=Ancylostoma duodenale TaxID=51022 RepID=A0A0C2GIW0_9BILA|nr:hypothetical protein ANCDUO_12800 [Ancylostoma duodenale]
MVKATFNHKEIVGHKRTVAFVRVMRYKRRPKGLYSWRQQAPAAGKDLPPPPPYPAGRKAPMVM